MNSGNKIHPAFQLLLRHLNQKSNCPRIPSLITLPQAETPHTYLTSPIPKPTRGQVYEVHFAHPPSWFSSAEPELSVRLAHSGLYALQVSVIFGASAVQVLGISEAEVSLRLSWLAGTDQEEIRKLKSLFSI